MILPDINEADQDLDIETGPIKLSKVQNSIYKLKNYKAPGEDGVCAGILKAEGMETPHILQLMLQDIWTEGLEERSNY